MAKTYGTEGPVKGLISEHQAFWGGICRNMQRAGCCDWVVQISDLPHLCLDEETANDCDVRLLAWINDETALLVRYDPNVEYGVSVLEGAAEVSVKLQTQPAIYGSDPDWFPAGDVIARRFDGPATVGGDRLCAGHWSIEDASGNPDGFGVLCRVTDTDSAPDKVAFLVEAIREETTKRVLRAGSGHSTRNPYDGE